MFKKLQQGDVIGIIAPAGWVDEARLASGLNAVQSAGFTPLIAPQVYAKHGRFAGDDAARTEAVEQAFANPDVKAILCVRGGYGSQRFVDSLNYALIAQNPKPLVGYSDITTLLNAITARCGFPTFLGGMLGDVARFDSPASWQHLWALLQGAPLNPTHHPACGQARVLKEGTAEGVLRGGNLSMLTTDCATPTMLHTADALLVIEEVGEDLYRFDRMLWQLKRAGLLSPAKGFIFGEMVGVHDIGEPQFGQTLEQIILDHCGSLGVPVVCNFPCGHGTHRTPLPLGVRAQLTAQHPSGIALHHSPLFG